MAADLRAARPQAAAGKLVRACAASRRATLLGVRHDCLYILRCSGADVSVAAGGRRAGTGSKGDTVQTTLLGLAIAFIIALVAALIGPYFIDWNQFRPQFEAEARRVIGAPARVARAR